MNVYGESGHPCLMPVCCGIHGESTLSMVTLNVGLLYIALTRLRSLSGMPKVLSAGISNCWSTLSNAFPQSRHESAPLNPILSA